MLKKRTISQMMEGSSCNCENDFIVGQGRYDAMAMSPSTTTLLHIPVEILEYILMKAIILEVKDLRQAKTTWKRKADSAIRRLKMVCLQWSCLMTDTFRNKVHRILEGSAHIPIVLERLGELEMSFHGKPLCIATTNDELYVLYRRRHKYINVFNRNNLQDMKTIIRESKLKVYPETIAACSLANCVYVLGDRNDTSSVMRITKDDEQQFHVTPLIQGLLLETGCMSVSANGSLILSSIEKSDALVSIYNMDGSLQHEIRLSTGVYSVLSIFPKSSGNLVLNIVTNERHKRLTEIDMEGNIVGQFESSLIAYAQISVVSYDRIMVLNSDTRMKLLDSELNLMEVTLPEEWRTIWLYPEVVHYDRLRNEVLVFTEHVDTVSTQKTCYIFRFREEK